MKRGIEANFLKKNYKKNTWIRISKVLKIGDKVLISRDWDFIRYCKSKGFIACHPEEIFTF